jgi:hypothetical protein
MKHPRFAVAVGIVTVLAAVLVCALVVVPGASSPTTRSRAATNTRATGTPAPDPRLTPQQLQQQVMQLQQQAIQAALADPTPAAKKPGWDGGPDGLPDGIPVDDRSGYTPGCVKKSDLFGPPLAPPGTPQTPGDPLGTPVYDSNGQVVGYVGAPGGGQYYPKSLVGEAAELSACNTTFSQGTAALSAACKQLLVEQGTPASALAGR